MLFPRQKTWVSNEVLTAADLNGEFNNILNNGNLTGIEGASTNASAMQSTTDPGGVGTESLAADLLGELKRIRYAIKRIVGGAQWYSAPVIDLGSTIGTADIADNAVTAAKIPSGAISQVKMAATGVQISADCGSFSITSASDTDVTNLSVSITTTGRPVRVELIGTDFASYSSYLQFTRTAEACGGHLLIKRGTGTVGYYPYSGQAGNAANMTIKVPIHIGLTDYAVEGAASTYTYKVQAALDTTANASSGTLFRVKLVAYEI